MDSDSNIVKKIKKNLKKAKEDKIRFESENLLYIQKLSKELLLSIK